jgi:hypothetical protein
MIEAGGTIIWEWEKEDDDYDYGALAERVFLRMLQIAREGRG